MRRSVRVTRVVTVRAPGAGAEQNMASDAVPGRYLLSHRDPRPERADQLAEVRKVYGYRLDHGFPVASELREDDQPAVRWQLRSLEVQQRMRLNLRVLRQRGRWNFVNDLPPLAPVKLAAMIRSGDVPGLVDYFMPLPGGVTGGREKTIADLRDVFALYSPPPAADEFETDEYFAELFVAGPDPTRLRRMTAVPAKFPLTDAHLGGESLAGAVAAGRIYWADYEAMAALDNGSHPQFPKFMYAPMAALAVPRDGGPLRPIAIQCGQDPAGRTIYTPADGYSWKLAKNCVLAAHNTYHEVLTHLGFTHLISEPILIAAVRHLAVNHPVMVLLRRHFEGTASINKLAVDLLIQPGRAVEYLIGSGLESTHRFLGERRAAFSFTGNYLPARIAEAGLADPRALGHHPYRDDGLLVWTAIRDWVSDFVTAFYREPDVLSDHELQGWAAEVAAADGGQIRDFGATPGQIGSRADLIEILTMIIWTAGPQHAAVNFPQKDHLAFLAANPLAGYTPEPRGHGHTEADWLDNLPPLDVAVQQFCVMTFLGSVRHTRLGDYRSDFTGTPAATAHGRFRDALAATETEIAGRNRRRAQPYEYLRPSLIPNSTNI
ncbi:MAG: Lipoxygenase [Actinomycetia bacterium]|nr:Lipoxygenase [Actinomycetes bacterium]